MWGLDEVAISNWGLRGGHAPYMGITRSPLHQNQGKVPLPLFGGFLKLILHYFIRQNYH